MSDDTKQIILANMNVKLYSWLFTFHKVVRQQTWGEVTVLIHFFHIFSAYLFEFNSEKNYDNWSTFAEVMIKKSGTYFWDTVCVQAHVTSEAILRQQSTYNQ